LDIGEFFKRTPVIASACDAIQCQKEKFWIASVLKNLAMTINPKANHKGRIM